MNKTTSFYLDLLRVVAAFGVLFSHASLYLFSDQLYIGSTMGHKLVMIFFVLSGFLIAYTVNKKNRGSIQYLKDRFSRLYSVVLPALLFTYVLDFIGKHYNPAVYAVEIAHNHQFLRFFSNATFLQEIWGFSSKPSTNGPFWSISYEFWYYMLFWGYSFFSGRKRYLILGFLSLFIGYKILILLPVWVFGVLAFNYANKLTISFKAAGFIFISTFTTLIILTFFWDFTFYKESFIFGHPPLYFSSQFMFDWLYGAIMALNLFSIGFISSKVSIPAIIEKVVKYLSSVTFTLYLFHFPILVFLGAVVYYNKSSYLQTSLLLLLVLLITSFIANVTEKQRNHWKNLFDKLYHSFENSTRD